MTFHEYQQEANQTAIYPGRRNNLYYPVLGLCGEAGEVAEQVKKMHRDDNGVITGARLDAIVKELGDVLWYVNAVCFEVGIGLDDVARANLAKLRSRQERGVLGGSGDNR